MLVYVVDTLRADAVGAYGSADARTPHFDALAAEGVVFDSAYANASWTRASMASLLTGLLPWHHRTEGRPDRLPETARTLAELFAEQGYATALISANPNVGRVFGFQQAFEHLGELFARSTPGLVSGRELVTPSPVVTDEAVAWLRGVDRPFFLVALPIDPHHPYLPPRRHDPGRHPDASATGDGPSRTRARMRELYQGEVAYNDESFGRLVAAMRTLGLWDDTIVVVTSDHGEELWEHGRRGHGKSLSEEVLRVPLIVRHPDDPRVPSGARVERPVSLVDLAPTLLDLAGLPVPGRVDGRRLFADAPGGAVPVLAGLDVDGHHLLSASDGRYKLVWDVATDRRHLYDLHGPGGESQPLDPDAAPGARPAQARLGAALAESLARDDRALGRSRAGALPEDVEASLRALGYLD